MAITLPLGIRVAAGLLGATIDRIGKLPEELPTLGVTLAGQVVRTSMRVRQELAELATRGDDLLAGLTGGAEEHPPWATFDEDEPTDGAIADAAADEVAPVADGAEPGGDFDDGTDHAGSLVPDVDGAAPPPTVDEIPPTSTPRSTTSKSGPTTATSPTRSAGRQRPTAPVTEELPTNTLRERSARIGPRVGARTDPNGSARNGTTDSGRPDLAGGTRTNSAGGTRTGTTGTVRRPRNAHIDADHQLTVAQLKERMRTLDSSAVRELLQQEESGPNRAAYLTLLSNRLATLAHENR